MKHISNSGWKKPFTAVLSIIPGHPIETVPYIICLHLEYIPESNCNGRKLTKSFDTILLVGVFFQMFVRYKIRISLMFQLSFHPLVVVIQIQFMVVTLMLYVQLREIISWYHPFPEDQISL